MIHKAQMQTARDKTVISGLRWYVSDRYVLLITVGGDFSQTDKLYVSLFLPCVMLAYDFHKTALNL